ncbi:MULTISPECIES: hypothetical protein [unclassified Amycolatopsis]|uniref:hypothetical protein n=1 Tax=unclassified Amycolatopsis TaxID=2618356 RepID=UPI00287625DD|nr:MULTISPECIES: hypothetical protein [unclassified Amycolatopsis]MDS0139230.1 hypothetical protein [Amycolatopsis sp. 505]MDS0144462.1 hypothetical protein [Amycolatopsis sp. CM201R]
MNNDNVSTRPSTPVLLWLVLVISATVNAGGLLVGLDLLPRTIAGGIAVAAIAGLVTHYVRRRRQA